MQVPIAHMEKNGLISYFCGVGTDFRTALIRHMKDNSVSINRLAEGANVSPDVIKKLRTRPKSSTNAETAADIARFFGKSVQQFMSLDEEPDTRRNLHSIAHSIRYMAKAWQWTPSRVQRFLNRMKKLEMICSKIDTGADTPADTGVSVITICNYDEYQSGAQAADTGPTRDPIQDRYRSDTEKKKDERRMKEGLNIASEDKSPDDAFAHKPKEVKDLVWEIGRPYLGSFGISDPGKMIGLFCADFSCAKCHFSACTIADWHL